MIKTHTTLQLWTRLDMLKSTLRRFLEGASGNHSAEFLTTLVDIGIGERLIQRADLYAKDSSGLTHDHIWITFNYGLFDNEVKFASSFDSNTYEFKDFSQGEGMPSEVRRYMWSFQENALQRNHRIEFTVRYMPGVDRDATNKRLGLVPADEIKYANGTQIPSSSSIDYLKELGVGRILIRRP